MTKRNIDKSVTFPVGKEDFLRKSVKIFFPTLLVVSGAIVALDGWLDLHMTPSRSSIYLLETSIAIAISTLVTAISFARYYRKLYHIFNKRELVRKVYLDRSWLQAHYDEVIINAKTELLACGISLHTLTTFHDLSFQIKRALSKSLSLQIHLLYLEAYSDIVMQREREESRPKDRISDDINANLRQALNIKKSLADIGNRFHVYLIQKYSPIGFFLLSDNDLYFEPYMHRSIGRTCPIIQMNRNTENKEIFDRFHEHIFSLKEDAIELIEHPLTQEIFHTPFSRIPARSLIKRAVYLDRDGVLMEDFGYISDPEKVTLLPDVVQFLRALQNSFRLIIVTNQSGIARGKFTRDELSLVNQRLLDKLAEQDLFLDAIYYCPHLPFPEGIISEYAIECNCRKPKTGMITRAAEYFNIDLQSSFVIGDKATDIKAGKDVNAKTILLRKTDSVRSEVQPDKIVTNFNDALNFIFEFGEHKTSHNT